MYRRPGTKGRHAWATALLVVAAACKSGSAGPVTEDLGGTDGCEDASAHPRVSKVGLSTPESVLHDPVADVYLVSNIVGGPGEDDDNGFISRLASDGSVLELAWIDGTKGEVELDAPKGMAVAGERLYVTDITVIRAFDRSTGAATATIEFPDAGFLNDLAADAAGRLVVTDMNRSRIHRLDPLAQPVVVETILEANVVDKPNGVTVDAAGEVWAVAAGQLFRVADGAAVDVTPLPAASLDGVEWTVGGTVLVSSWETETVYEGKPGEAFTARVCGLESPADLGYDRLRGRVLVPLFQRDEIALVDL